MTTLTPRCTRTITGYVSELLEYPRWYIERDIDFTRCKFHGRYEPAAGTCRSCEFGAGCLWLNRKRSPTVDKAALPELIKALEVAVHYLAEHSRHDLDCDCATCHWIHEARAMLRSQSHWK